VREWTVKDFHSAVELAHFAAIVAHSDDAIISKTLKGIVTSWNKGAERLYGFTAEEMIGTPLERLIPVGMPDEEPMILSRIQRGEIIDHYETVRVTKDGRTIDVSVTISPIKDATGEIVGASKIARDITAQKRAQAELAAALEEAETAKQAAEEAKQMAESANLAKSEFLANMSHELRTPMNAIMGAADLLEKLAELPDRDKQLVQTIQVSSESLLTLINDLLDLSRIEARSLEMESIPFKFTDIAPQIVSLVQLKAREKGLVLRVEYEGTDGQTYLGDPTRLRQIVLNLCSNAVKFTEAGRVSLAFSSVSEGKGQERIKIVVSDTGIGIPLEKQSVIFDKFVQSDSTINRRYGGTGLGLTIAKRLTEAMGGTLTVESTVGKGSKFEVSVLLPLTTEEKEPEHPRFSAGAAEGKILLVEDYGPSGYVASTFLEMEGYSVDLVESGPEAIERMKKGGYLTALMDVQMPGLNGYEATKIIREYETEVGRNRAYIIGMTAHAMPGDREKCLAAGMDDYVSKPFDAETLKRKLAALPR
jgi:PAS domain S-box-containing protein